MSILHGLKRRASGTRALVRPKASRGSVRGWRPQGFDILFAVVVLGVGLAVAYPLIW